MGSGRPRHPALYQVNTRAWLHERGRAAGQPATLDDVSDAELDEIAADGFDWVWLLGVWETGEAGRQVSRREPSWQREYRELLPDFTDADVCGSPFAVQAYTVGRALGGGPALARLRERLARRGVGLVLDFVPNHTALDHPWVYDHPEFYVHGTEDDRAREPGHYTLAQTRAGRRVLAHGRDPYLPAWPDTLQLNYRHAGLRAEMRGVLERLAGQCDGLRCDMAMLVLPDIVQRTWGERAQPADGSTPVEGSFWPEAIAAVRQRHPQFLFVAEVYWDFEWRLQQEGFDYTYDKRLYDRLRARDAAGVLAHLGADIEYQRRLLRFIENHDESRAAAAFPAAVHQAAAVLGLLAPGLRLVHDGQLTGRRLRMSNHLCRRAPEAVDRELQGFYRQLLACMRRPQIRDGAWELARAQTTTGGDPAAQLVGYRWRGGGGELVVAVNYGPERSRGSLALPDLPPGASTRLRDLLPAPDTEERSSWDVREGRLFLDLPGWRAHAFELPRT